MLVLPAVLTALAIRADAVLIGPYWTFTAIVPGLEGVDADMWYERPALRNAIIRRYAYVALASAAMSALFAEWGTWHAGVLGGAIAGLLLWPIVFHGLPYGVLRRDWQLAPLYLGVVLSFLSAAIVGELMWGYVDAQANGDPVRWLRDHALEGLFWAAMTLMGTAFFRGALGSLRTKSRARYDDAES
jgi:hypothetical protein